MPVKHISTMDEYNAVLETSKTKLVIMDFSADW
jgi:thiol:disulfide interchange protein